MHLPNIPWRHRSTSNLEPSGEFKHILALRMINILMIGACLFVLFVTVFFIYERVYRAIEDVEVTVTQNPDFLSEVINFDRLERVTASWTKKHKTDLAHTLRNPFAAPTTTSP